MNEIFKLCIKNYNTTLRLLKMGNVLNRQGLINGRIYIPNNEMRYCVTNIY